MPAMADRRPKFQFRLQDLLWAIGLIAVALGEWVAFIRFKKWSADPFLFSLIFVYFSSIACFGAGIGCLFRKPIRGGCIGLAFALVLGVVLVGVLAYFINKWIDDPSSIPGRHEFRFLPPEQAE